MLTFNRESFILYMLSLSSSDYSKCFFIVKPDLVVAGTLDGTLFIYDEKLGADHYRFIQYDMRNTIDNESKLKFMENRFKKIISGEIDEFISDYENYIVSNKVIKDTYYLIPKSFGIES